MRRPYFRIGIMDSPAKPLKDLRGKFVPAPDEGGRLIFVRTASTCRGRRNKGNTQLENARILGERLRVMAS
jgi:hypothetical protein